MKRFTDSQIQKILCIATERKVLILTVADNTAAVLLDSVEEYIIRRGLGNSIARYQPYHGWLYFNGGFETIIITQYERWNEHKRNRLVRFDGAVYVTNSSIKEVKHIQACPKPITSIWKENGENDR